METSLREVLDGMEDATARDFREGSWDEVRWAAADMVRDLERGRNRQAFGEDWKRIVTGARKWYGVA